MRLVCSTVACPEMMLDQAAELATDAGFGGLELRTFGVDSRSFACDPALTGPEKVRRVVSRAGASVSGLATGVTFDALIEPPVVGLFLDHEGAVREAERAVDLAGQIGAGYVRVFGNSIPKRSSRGATIARIAKRLTTVVDHARNSPVRVVLENGGDFGSASDILEIAERVDRSGLDGLGLAYSIAPGVDAGDDPAQAVRELGRYLRVVRVKDRKGSTLCPLGEGDLGVQGCVEALARLRFNGDVVYEWDRAWLPDLAPASEVLPAACRTLFGWVHGNTNAATREAVGV